MGRYLDRLPVRQVPTRRRARSRSIRALPMTGLFVVVGLLASMGLAAAALTHLVGGISDQRIVPSAAASCLSASFEPLAASRVRGRARVCKADGSLVWAFDLQHLTGGAAYAGWLATFEDPEQCRFGGLAHYVPGFRQPCTLDDLTAPEAHADLHWLAETSADTSGTAHVDDLVGDAPRPPHAQAWLLVAPASLLHAAPAQADWVARAEFDLRDRYVQTYPARAPRRLVTRACPGAMTTAPPRTVPG